MKIEINDAYCRRQRSKGRLFSFKMAVEHRAKALGNVALGNDQEFFEMQISLLRAVEDLTTEFEEHRNLSELILMLKEEEVA